MSIDTDDHSMGNSLGELSILSEDLLCDLGKQSTNSDKFYCLALVSLAEIVHILAKGELVELFRRLGHGFDSRKKGGHPVGESKLRDRRDLRGQSGWKLCVSW